MTGNDIMLVAFFGWFAAQFLKIVLDLIFKKKFDFSRIVGSGGMPSSHSSLVCSATTSVGYACGFDSILFAVCCIYSVIVMYDASGVRRAAGEQAKILNLIIETWDSDTFEGKQIKLKELLGHTPLQVVAGAILGILIAMLYEVI